ncbi:MAG: ATP-binding cassette domain-containing protein [Devosiaceae bacterium]|nr:ATP-binding cassette domain-containing protein [Devosiaceae bacterium MH13]
MIRLDQVALTLGDSAHFRFDLTVEAGETVGVVGPSGAGKSTLFDIIAGYHLPAEGQVYLSGEDHTHTPPSGRPVSFMFQSNNVFDHLDVATNVGLGISPHFKRDSKSLAVVREALEKVGLEGFEARRAAALSGGEAQRVALARVLVRDRPVLLLDEPFAALGPSMRADLSSLVRDLQAARQLTVLMISHAPTELRGICERLLFLQAGTVVQDGPLEAILGAGPETPMGRYLGARPTPPSSP